jgi:hypothetical protein
LVAETEVRYNDFKVARSNFAVVVAVSVARATEQRNYSFKVARSNFGVLVNVAIDKSYVLASETCSSKSDFQ